MASIIQEIRQRYKAAIAPTELTPAAIKATPTNRGKSAVLLWPEFRNNVPYQWRAGEFANYAEEGFTLNGLIYCAIMYKVRAQYSAPLRAYIGDPENPDPAPPNHPLARLLARPNPVQSWAQFQGVNTLFLNLSGNAYIYIERDSAGVPSRLRSIRPDRVWCVPNKTQDELMGYLVVQEGQSYQDGMPVSPEDMIHVKFPNPLDPFGGLGPGLSPLASLAYSGDVDNAVTRFLKTFFDRGAMMAGILKFDDPLDDDAIAKIKERWKAQYGGSDNWSEIGVLSSGGEYQQLTMTFEQMGFQAIDDRNQRRILAPFGVGVSLLNNDESKYANAETAKRQFWQDVFRPELMMFEQEYNAHLAMSDGSFVAFDFTEVSQLQRDRAAQIGMFNTLFSAGYTRNAAAKAAGLDIEEMPDGDVQYMSPALVPISKGGKMVEQPAPPAPKPGAETTESGAEPNEDRAASPLEGLPAASEGKGLDMPDAMPAAPRRLENIVLATRPFAKLLSYEQKANHWRRNDNSARAWESRFSAAAADAFERDKRALLAMLTETRRKAYQLKSTPNWEQLLLDFGDYWEKEGAENWRAIFEPVIAGVMGAAGKELAYTFGYEFDTRNLRGEEWYNQYVLKFAQPILQTSSDEISNLLQQAMKEGWSIPQMQKRLTQMFTQWQTGETTPEDWEWYEQRIPPYRAAMIARTETIRASNAGAFGVMGDFGATHKEWLATPDNRTRETHAEAWAKYSAGGSIGPIPIDEPFIVGNSRLMYPGDPDGEPGETIQCRCTVLPAWVEEKAFPGLRGKAYNPDQPRDENGRFASSPGGESGAPKREGATDKKKPDTSDMVTAFGNSGHGGESDAPKHVGETDEEILDRYGVDDDGRAIYKRVMKLDSTEAQDMLARAGVTREEALARIAEARRIADSVEPTRDKHFVNGAYDEARVKVHQQIINDLVANCPSVPEGESPELLLTGGLPGAGKSAMLRSEEYAGLKGRFVHLDSDDIKERLAAKDGITNLGAYARAYHAEADDVLAEALGASAKQRKNILFDSTMKNGNKSVALIETYKQLGYKVGVAFADLPIDKAMTRAIGRFLEGGAVC